MTRIHDSKVNNIAECNLLHHILNPPKRTKKLNIYYSPIINGLMNTRKGKQSLRPFKSYWIVDLVPRL